MKVGIPKEIKNNENRVGMTPSGVSMMVEAGHDVYVQSTAGMGSGYSDENYTAAGATILPTIEDVYATADMIVKVKEPIEPEYELCREGQLLFTYFHFASSEPLTHAMIKSKATCLAYETVVGEDGRLPLLDPMSEVAGRLSVQEGAKYLQAPQGGRGVLLGGVPGVAPGHVVVIGGGTVGSHAARMAAGLGARVTILEKSMKQARYLEDTMPANVTTVYSNDHNLRELLPTADLVIGAVLIPGAKAPKLLKRDMLRLMKPRTVIVDVAVDQGGCFETTKATYHADPTFVVDDIVHYCVANMPGAVPYTSTLALTNATLPYAIALANQGWHEAVKSIPGLLPGLNVVNGKVVFKSVADAFDLPYHEDPFTA